MTDIFPTRGFAVSSPEIPTKVDIAELSDGSIQIFLITDRNGMEPLETGFRLSAKTFSILSEALARAAHDPYIWHEIKKD